MRAVLVAAMGFLALSGCDQLGLGQHTAQTAPPPCHCTAAAPAEQLARLTPPVAHHHHHHVAHSYSQSWADDYAEQSPSYSSESRSYDEDSQSSDESQSTREDGWVDGYGREHYGAGVTRVAAEDRKRLDPWHGYKSKCGDKERE